ncbi:MAG TPA: DUF4136 domain-containing protein [Cyclobacteriaceae bacterium]|nr:DUF4136 domain-containing protein [Cyclobacteriaceae bacterium]
MIKHLVLYALLLSAYTAMGQEFKVEYDKDRDYTQYKTFRFGEGELTTPKDQQQVTAEQVDKWIKDSVTKELELRGLKQVDSAADLVVSYVVGTLSKSDAGSVGPMGLTPGSMDRNYSRDYRMGNLVIDMNDKRSLMVWRINATFEMSSASAQSLIDAVVQKGFKKYPKPAKKKKK